MSKESIERVPIIDRKGNGIMNHLKCQDVDEPEPQSALRNIFSAFMSIFFCGTKSSVTFERIRRRFLETCGKVEVNGKNS